MWRPQMAAAAAVGLGLVEDGLGFASYRLVACFICLSKPPDRAVAVVHAISVDYVAIRLEWSCLLLLDLVIDDEPCWLSVDGELGVMREQRAGWRQ